MKNKILLLEDDNALVEGLVYALGKSEFDVYVARNVSEAKKLWTNGIYDILLLILHFLMGLDYNFVRILEIKEVMCLLFF
jgi:DNA-binding response OmpR family regulator